MNLSGLQRIYMLGIGGIGMSALARYFHGLGIEVRGYDKTPSAVTDGLQSIGISVYFKDEPNRVVDFLGQVSNLQLVIYTPAIPAAQEELKAVQSAGYPLMKRAQLLGLISASQKTYAVAGTHGKTTTSTLLSHLLHQAGKDISAFLGGISTNYNTNYIAAKDPAIAPVVVEADEFDRSFLHLHPNVAIVTSVDADHLDIYGKPEEFQEGFQLFVDQVRPDGVVFMRYDLGLKTKAKRYTYGLEQGDYRTENLRVEHGAYRFDLVHPQGRIDNLTCGLPGRHNAENAVAASAVALYEGLNEEQLREGLASFRGVKRRFEYHVMGERIYIDDYAHHPKELQASIGSAKELYPNKRITGIFQPHLYSRTRDFMDAFAESLSALDECILLDIYPAREEPIEGVSAAVLLDRVKLGKKTLLAKSELCAKVKEWNPEVLLSLGAGDIDRLVPELKEAMA